MTEQKISIRYLKRSKLTRYERNVMQHSGEQVEQIAASIREFGWTNPVLIDEAGEIIAGHGRLAAAEVLNIDDIPTITLTGLTDAQKRAYRLADNKLPLNAGWDEELLSLELSDLVAEGFDITLAGFDPADLDLAAPELPPEVIDRKGNLAKQFLVPPFTVLNARDGWWMDRKRDWLSLGINSETGRADDLTFNGFVSPPMMDEKNKLEGELGRKLDWAEFYKLHPDAEKTGTSVFDPVLCELAYNWFSPAGGVVVDPFAGGSVRGIVASHLGRHYYGVDLRKEQIDANRAQWEGMEKRGPAPAWFNGDSTGITKILEGKEADLIFTCPPYADLEVYSDNPADLSTMNYRDFVEAYRVIIRESLALLKNDRFAVIVVGEVRDKKGIYRNFVGDTISAFVDAGASFYNEAILVTPIGSLPVRVGGMFKPSRKLGKSHQNVLVFVKGDPQRATAACGDVDISESLAALEQ